MIRGAIINAPITLHLIEVLKKVNINGGRMLAEMIHAKKKNEKQFWEKKISKKRIYKLILDGIVLLFRLLQIFNVAKAQST